VLAVYWDTARDAKINPTVTSRTTFTDGKTEEGARTLLLHDWRALEKDLEGTGQQELSLE